MILAVVALLGGCAHGPGGDPVNRVVWRDRLASSGQPSRAYLARAHERSYAAVINLAPPDSMGSIADEGAIVTAQGLAYVSIAVDFDKPSLMDFDAFSVAMQRLAGRNVLVHCQLNFRAASFVYLYRVIHENAPGGAAAATLTGVWVPNAVWTRFIDDTMAHYGKTAEIL